MRFSQRKLDTQIALRSLLCFALRNSTAYNLSKMAIVALELTEWVVFEIFRSG